MKEENKRCCNCMYYRPYYTKEYNHFIKQDKGLCKRKDVVQKCDVCELWSNKIFRRQTHIELTKSAVLNSLNETIKNLTEIGQILRELQDDY